MNATSTAKADYLLLFRGNVWDRGLSPAQLQKVVSDWMAWFERLKAEGKCLGGHPLEGEGKVVSGKRARSPTVRLRNRRKRLAVTSISRSRTRTKRSRSPNSVRAWNTVPWLRFGRSAMSVRSSSAHRSTPPGSSPEPRRNQRHETKPRARLQMPRLGDLSRNPHLNPLPQGEETRSESGLSKEYAQRQVRGSSPGYL